MTTHRDIEQTFYAMAKMAGIEQREPDTFYFEGKKIRANASVDDATAKAFGGKRRAFKLLRHASIIQHVAASPDGAHIAGVMDASFDAVSRHYPLLRSYYEGMLIGGRPHTWLRWS
jgi:hypothetical protein